MKIKNKRLILYRKPKKTKDSWYSETTDKNGKTIWRDLNGCRNPIVIKKQKETILLPKRIQNFIPKWETKIDGITDKEIDLIKNSELPYYIKGISIDFIYRNKMYSILPKTFKNNQRENVNEILYFMFPIIKKDLESIGCRYSNCLRFSCRRNKQTGVLRYYNWEG